MQTEVSSYPVRRFIAIDVGIEREAYLGDPSKQRSEIARLQKEILDALKGYYDPTTLVQYRTLPSLALDLKLEGLAKLDELVQAHQNSPNLPNLNVVADAPVRAHRGPAVPMKEAMGLTRIDSLPGTADGTDQVLVVIDDGVSDGVDVLAGKVVGGGFITSNQKANCNGANVTTCFHDPKDGAPLGKTLSHGTQVAAVACGTIGVAPGAKCFSIRVADENNIMLFSDVVKALEVFYLDWSGTYPNSVVNLSLGVSKLLFDTVGDCNTSAFGPTTKYACLNLIDKNIPVVASAGNDGSSTGTSFPGCLQEVITVGATTKCVQDGVHERSPASNWGPLVDISTPGANIVATVQGAPFGLSPGTSIAAPQVAGLLLRMRQAHPDCEYKLLRQAVLESSAVAGPTSNPVPFLDARTAWAVLGSLCPHP